MRELQGVVADEHADPLAELLHGAAPADARGEHGDLLAAPAGHDVGRPEPVDDPVDDLHEDLVADAVRVAVVDRLEAVDVHDEQPGGLSAPHDARVLGDERLLEGTPVGGAGELVAACDLLLCSQLPQGDLA